MTPKSTLSSEQLPAPTANNNSGDDGGISDEIIGALIGAASTIFGVILTFILTRKYLNKDGDNDHNSTGPEEVTGGAVADGAQAPGRGEAPRPPPLGMTVVNRDCLGAR